MLSVDTRKSGVLLAVLNFHTCLKFMKRAASEALQSSYKRAAWLALKPPADDCGQ